MMGERRGDQWALFYEFPLDQHVPADHLLRAFDRFVEMDGFKAGKAVHVCERLRVPAARQRTQADVDAVITMGIA